MRMPGKYQEQHCRKSCHIDKRYGRLRGAIFYWVIAITSSSTYNFQPSAGDLVLNAFARCGIRAPELTAQHLADASMECNLLASQFSNRNPNQFLMETPTIPLVQGQAVYQLPSRTVAIGIIYLTLGTGAAAFDTPMGPISATDWGAISVKSTQGQPTTAVFTLLPIPTLTVWPVPDANGPYLLSAQSFRQMQDVSLSGGQTIDAPFRFLDAFTAGLAARLARIYAPALYQLRKQDFEEIWMETTMRDTQDCNLYITPALSAYYR